MTITPELLEKHIDNLGDAAIEFRNNESHAYAAEVERARDFLLAHIRQLTEERDLLRAEVKAGRDSDAAKAAWVSHNLGDIYGCQNARRIFEEKWADLQGHRNLTDAFDKRSQP